MKRNETNYSTTDTTTSIMFDSFDVRYMRYLLTESVCPKTRLFLFASVSP